MKMTKPWPKENLIKSTGRYDVFKDNFPINPGHVLFVPRVDEEQDVVNCLEAAYRYGKQMVENGEWEAFNVGLNYGEAAGQTCSWSHVQLIPRISGDCQDPRGGVRNVVPERGNYLTSDYFKETRIRLGME